MTSEHEQQRPDHQTLEVGPLSTAVPRRGWLVLGVIASLILAISITIGVTVGGDPDDPGAGGAQSGAVTSPVDPSATHDGSAAPDPDPVPAPEPMTLPGGRTQIFTEDNILVAYYGTAGTGALGVLGENSPDKSDRKLRSQALKYVRAGARVQKVYELIVTIADAYPGDDGDYNHDISKRAVKRWIAAAHRNNALVVLDIQPGRSSFLKVAKRWAWALEDPWVGLALDPEWRMHGNAVPGRKIGHVDAGEINRTTAWLADFTAQRGLPEKVVVLHQFRRDMIRRITKVKSRPGLAMVQHVDGFGTPGQKMSTYRHVAKPQQFAMGYKVFYDEDTRRLKARDVLKIRPRVRFVSYQ